MAATIQLARPEPTRLRWLWLLPALWVLAEWVRGWFLSGFPWLALGYTQLGTGLRGFAPVLGVYGVSLAVAVSAGALVTLLLGRQADRIVAGVIALSVWGTGTALARIEWTVERGAPLRVALVQGAVPQSMKWDSDQRAHTMELYSNLMMPYLGHEIIVWPESAIPALEENVRPYLENMSALANESGSALVMGLLRLGFLANFLSHPVISGFISASGLLITASHGLQLYVADRWALDRASRRLLERFL